VPEASSLDQILQTSGRHCFFEPTAQTTTMSMSQNATQPTTTVQVEWPKFISVLNLLLFRKYHQI